MQILDELKQAGVLEHLSPKDMTLVEKRVANINVMSPTLALNVLQEIPDAIFPMGYRVLRDSAIDPRVLDQLRCISHGQLVLSIDEIIPHMWGIDYAINQALARQGRSDRFYWIKYPDDGTYGPMRPWALVYLSYAQFKQLNQRRVLRLDTPFAWDKTRVLDVVHTLDELGLLSHLSEIGKEEALQGVFALDIDERSLSAVMEAFGLACRVDSEMIYDIDKDYRKLITWTCRLSRGLFDVENVQIGELDSERYFTISFTYEGQTFSKRIELQLDWINWDYLAFLNGTLASTGKSHRYCLLETDDQTAPIVFLSGRQLEEVTEQNLLPLDEKWDPLLGYRVS